MPLASAKWTNKGVYIFFLKQEVSLSNAIQKEQTRVSKQLALTVINHLQKLQIVVLSASMATPSS
jgi:hypothetical protein